MARKDATRAIREALALLRGLLAEPQPSITDADVDRIYRRLDGGTWGTTSKDCIRAVLHAAGVALAEPQVNPSEAKARSELIKAGVLTVAEINRTRQPGGEESREP
jgi:hypothetical protein